MIDFQWTSSYHFMNYQWHYERLIDSRKNRIKEDGKYYERHHIVLKSMGGNNSPENLIYLTAREHFIAHWLLWRIHRNKQTSLAFFCMTEFKNKKSQGHQRNFSSRGYSEAIESLSLIKKTHTEETKKLLSDMKTGVKLGPISEERSNKLKLYFENNKYEEIKICCKCGKEFIISKKSSSNTMFCSKKCASQSSNRTKCKVEVLNRHTNEKTTFCSICSAAKKLNIHRSQIYSYKGHDDYIFKIIKE